jgi:site-specific DNA-methyltransferase (adenine-specific)
MSYLYFGDNLEILRQHIPDESIDLIYLDPPFNSKRNYNQFFKTPKGDESEAQAIAFRDTWSWTIQSEREFDDLKRSNYPHVMSVLIALRSFLRESSTMAYLVMMASRLIELHRVLKPTGNFFLHCDSTANHYLRVICDAIFEADNFRNEIIWKRASAHNDARKKMGTITDHILFYGKSSQSALNVQRTLLDQEYIKKSYRFTDEDGRLYRLDNMASPNPRPNLMYEWLGYQHPKKGWRYSRETMQQLHDEGRIYYPEDKTQRLSLKRYFDENEGAPVANLWDDIKALQSQSKEYLGYPTQKPQKLLERIIEFGSNPGDVVLDPFCGCGTAVHAAEALGRQWIGIDISHLAISLIEYRLKSAFAEIEFEVEGSPKDTAGAQNLFNRDPFQFEWWACSLVGAQPANKQKKGSDKGIDGIIYFTDAIDGKPITQKIIVSVKGGQNVGVAMIRELASVMKRDNAPIAFFVTLKEPTRDMLSEALGQGFYEAGNGRSYPRLQILTIEDLLSGRVKPDYYDMSVGEATFKKAPRQQKQTNQQNPLI